MQMMSTSALEGSLSGLPRVANRSDLQLPISAEEFQVSWSGVGAEVEAEVRQLGRAIAWLVPGTRPGLSARVVRDGPLAKVRKAGRRR